MKRFIKDDAQFYCYEKCPKKSFVASHSSRVHSRKLKRKYRSSTSFSVLFLFSFKKMCTYFITEHFSGYCLWNWNWILFFLLQNTSQVIIYEITRTKQRHKRLREVMLPTQAQTLRMFSDGRLCVGHQSGFSLYSIAGDHCPIRE